MKKTMKSNKGFSLVELIIVIAIIMILVGVMAPVFLKYLEKSKIGNDQQMLSAVYAAVVYASVDNDVLSDPDAKAMVDLMSVQPVRLDDILTPDNKFGQEVLDSLGWDSLSSSYYLEEIESTHSSDSEIWFMNKGSAVNPLAMWITYTDETGSKNISGPQPTDWTDLENCNNIAIR